MEHYDLLIIGAGAAGLSAAKTAWEADCRNILLVDRKSGPGGILQQCRHQGFGNGLTGPEYINNLLCNFSEEIPCLFNTSVVSLSAKKTALLKGPLVGEREVSFRQLILAAGCLEIPMGALPIAGTRPRGIYTAGQMQEMMNLHGFRPEGPVAILGSGDLGLIMAEHLVDAGIEVAGLVEQKPECGGMARNRHFLQDTPIPLLCSRTITEVRGFPKLESVILSDGTQMICKTLLIAAGLKPDKTLLHTVGMPSWLHLCGNCSKVYPMVEAVTLDGRQAAVNALSALSNSEEMR